MVYRFSDCAAAHLSVYVRFSVVYSMNSEIGVCVRKSNSYACI